MQQNMRDQLPPSLLIPSYLETEESLRHHLAVVRLLTSAEKRGLVPVAVLVSTERKDDFPTRHGLED